MMRRRVCVRKLVECAKCVLYDSMLLVGPRYLISRGLCQQARRHGNDRIAEVCEAEGLNCTR